MTGFWIGLGLAAIATGCGATLWLLRHPNYKLALYTGLAGLLLNGGSLLILR